MIKKGIKCVVKFWVTDEQQCDIRGRSEWQQCTLQLADCHCQLFIYVCSLLEHAKRDLHYSTWSLTSTEVH